MKSGYIFWGFLLCSGLLRAQRVDQLRMRDGRLSWALVSEEKNVKQTAYQVIVDGYWDSKKVSDWRSLHIPYRGKPLPPATTYTWKVRVWDNHGHVSPWSAPATGQTGLSNTSDWKGAAWIAYEALPDTALCLPGQKKRKVPEDVLPQFEKVLRIRSPLLRATAFVCGLGQFELKVNGEKVGDHFLDPGWTRYDKEAVYVPLDMHLKTGSDTLTVSLGNGFLYTPSERYRKLTGVYGYPKVKALFHLEYVDGHTEDIVTDASWKTAPSPTVFSSIYGGEDYDARLEDAPNWKPAVVVDGPPVHEQEEAPLKVTEVFAPRSVKQIRPDAWVYDLGQNMSGIAELAVQGRRGDTVRIYPGELVHEDGSVNQHATGSPYYWTYILKGDGVETWRPKFTYYGFRYLEVVGAAPADADASPTPADATSGRATLVSVRGLHTRNAADSTGSFTCSNELFNRIYTLIRWGIQNNMASVLTDCPHREKLGWLEQTHLMGNSIQYNYDLSALYRKMAHDMITSQTPDGLVPEIAPEFTVFGEPFRDSPEWGSACVLLPWSLYCWYGDSDIVRECYPMMRRYMTYLAGKADHYILTQGLGDWYDLGPNPPGYAQLTPQGLTATAFYYNDAVVLAKVAALLGRGDEARAYTALAGNIREAFNERFFHAGAAAADSAYYGTNSQTANAMALTLGLVDPKYRTAVLANLVRDVRARGLTAGDIGYHYLVRALAENSVLYDLNNQSSQPGYGYQLAKGATALTESWQALPTVSNDHLMLGHLMEWFFEDLAGIRAEDVAYHRIRIAPMPVGDLTSVSASYRSAYGWIISAWSMEGNDFVLKVHIPANTSAVISLPKRISHEVGSGDYVFKVKNYAGQVPDSVMQAVYTRVRTPYKYGLVIAPKDNDKKIDCPTVFRKDSTWFMTYLEFNGRGYQTWLARSTDLLHWSTLGKVLPFPADTTRWDAHQQAGYAGLEDLTFGGSYRLDKYQGRYWMSYFGGAAKGYEKGLLSIGMASTDKDPSVSHEWDRQDRPVLSSVDPDVAWWDNHTQYKETVIRDKEGLTGHPFVLYYNANGDSVNKKRGAERIGMAVSDDMVHWMRFGRDPVLNHGAGITGDPWIQKIGDVYVMFYFGAFWKGTNGAFNRFACSYDLVHWTDWTGANLIQSSEPFDNLFAHKSCVVSYKGVVYHFYCAVDKANQRGIAVATSEDKGASLVHFVGAPPQQGPPAAQAQAAAQGPPAVQPQAAAQGSRRVIPFDTSWAFRREGAAGSFGLVGDTAWTRVDLPHDWSIEGPFVNGDVAEGALPTGVGFYQKTFVAPDSWKGRKVYIEFDGIYKNSTVQLNGHLLGFRPSGYASFRYPLDSLLYGQENTIDVRVDNSLQPDARWYTGSGIYRHVRLVVTEPVAIDHWGVTVTNPAPDVLRVVTRVTGGHAVVHTDVVDARGRVVARDTGAEVTLPIPDAHLWSPSDPYLYKVVTTLEAGEAATTLRGDRVETMTGLRQIRFDAEKGFFLNGYRLQINGVCLHQDLGALGAAVNTQAMEHRLAQLKAMGCNAIRTAHNPPAPEFLDLCDRMGFLVMDEAFDMWARKKNKNDYHLDFDAWHQKDLEDMILRDRNHPCIIAWSIGNEIREQFDTSGIRLARELAATVRALDTTRPVTAALTETGQNYLFDAGALDVFGLNYHLEKISTFPQTHTGIPLIGSEDVSGLASRGDYDLPADSVRFWPSGPKEKNVPGHEDHSVSAYDNVAAYWGATHEATLDTIRKYPFVAGMFVWSGYDYLGEPTPYGWPSRSSYFGIIDLAGFPKDVYYLYQSVWTDRPVLHIDPHWNWSPGQRVDVRVYYNHADAVELFLNGRSLGRRSKTDGALHVSWTVPWAPGTLRAVALDRGKAVREVVVRTAGAAAQIALRADVPAGADVDAPSWAGTTSPVAGATMPTPGDLYFITATLLDAAGTPAPKAASLLHFQVEGAGRFVCADNGRQADTTSFQASEHRAYNGKCMIIVRRTGPGRITLKVTSDGLRPGTVMLGDKAPGAAAKGPGTPAGAAIKSAAAASGAAHKGAMTAAPGA
ncbi:family 78 glycoside hydrolase catalytic domain [Dinghuibacter silviterrae]|uniref:alpha-L-rhamnosidase n=1 Tax=Dinghuibacter silviterrae TaxID=1539049 RepID=A0A4R8DTY1_9BACT|nr:family 78 glycoside hydrolase catalytic domain [Dinghuibacter silviterrae]TDX01376.1 glycosyl hydrolase family 2 [Dinghuibacter silviterrae]